ncbi:MAG: hypothetical protein Q8M01_18980 [Rubrivivax sp.]|nr:hypothetical protein [Rubrivivax sp.]
MNRWLIRIPVVLLTACGGGGSSDPVPANPGATLETKLKADMARSLPLVANFESSLIGVLNPGTPLAQGVAMIPDTSPGAAPHSFIFSGPYDGNGDSINESTLSGRVTFNGDPAFEWSGMNGQVSLDVNIPVLGHVYRGDLAFNVTPSERRLSGSGTFTDPLSGNKTTMTIAATAPLIVKPATGLASATANACAYSLDGRMQIRLEATSGTLVSTWNFAPGSSSVLINAASFTDSSGQSSVVADSSVDLKCGASGSNADWAGSYEMSWACLPQESGSFRFTMTASGADAVNIDDDPPGPADGSLYQASVVNGNPHSLRGAYNLSGPPGNRFSEDFNWSLRKGGTSFTQVSRYTFIEGANQGKGGICIGNARRL